MTKRLLIGALFANALGLGALCWMAGRAMPPAPEQRATIDLGHAARDGRPCVQVSYWDGETVTYCIAPVPDSSV